MSMIRGSVVKRKNLTTKLNESKLYRDTKENGMMGKEKRNNWVTKVSFVIAALVRSKRLFD